MNTYQRMQPIQLCIPKMSNETPRRKIYEVFQKLNIGKIYRIFDNPLRTDPNFKRVVLYIEWDNTQPIAQQIQEKLQDPKEHINIVYDMPWYWQIYARHPQKQSRNMIESPDYPA